MNRIRAALTNLARQEPGLRSALVPVLKQADKWKTMPNGWDAGSREKFWESLTGDDKHKVTKCIKEMDGKVDDPGAFCASLADRVMGPEWRSKKAMRLEGIMTSTLPPVLKKVLAEVRSNKRKINVRIDTSFSMYSAGDDGAKGFTALVDIDTQQYNVTWGAFGGGALGMKPSPVDDVNTPKKPLLDHLVVVQGQIGGRDPYASLVMTDKAYARLTGAGRQAHETDKAVKKEALREFKDAYQAQMRVALRYMQANYTSLADAAVVTGDPRYGKGSTEVWYGKDNAMRDLMMGSSFLLRHGIALPDPENLPATHVFMGKVAVTHPDEVFGMMQGEVWSPEGQARSMAQKVGHTSMSVGDIVVVAGKPLMVDNHGFFDLQKQSKKAWAGRGGK